MKKRLDKLTMELKEVNAQKRDLNEKYLNLET